jgi:hypothetical protein
MAKRMNGRVPRKNRPPVGWMRWVRAWRDDREQHVAARTEARANAPLLTGERLLAVARGAGGELVAATDCALYHQTGEVWTRLGWEDVSRVHWYKELQVLVLTGFTPAVPARTVLRLAKDWDLAALAAERVSCAKLVDQRISLSGGATARVIARRAPGESQVRWLVILDRGLDPADPGIGAELKLALSELRALTGLEGRGDFEPWMT